MMMMMMKRRKGRSCLTNILTFLDKVTSYIDSELDVDVILLNFSQAFDKVPHQRLLSKSKSHGISGRVLDWIENCLSGRVQRVQVKGVKSFWESVTSGVPQGSGLGPVLFLIYINDLDEDILRLILKFADDTKIFSTIQSEVDAANLQRDIDKLLEWSEIWQMNFKVTKCKVMHIGKQYSEHQYSMNGHTLETVTEEKDLGILLTKYRKVAQQCSKACARANRMAGLIKMNIENKDKKIMLRLYALSSSSTLELYRYHFFNFDTISIRYLQNIAISILNK